MQRGGVCDAAAICADSGEIQASKRPVDSLADSGRYGQPARRQRFQRAEVTDGEARSNFEEGLVVGPRPTSKVVGVRGADVVATATEKLGGHHEGLSDEPASAT